MKIVYRFHVGEIPLDGPADTMFEGGLRPPAELILNLRGVNCVTAVMAGPVLHIRDESPARSDCGIGAKLIENVADGCDRLEIGSLVRPPML